MKTLDKIIKYLIFPLLATIAISILFNYLFTYISYEVWDIFPLSKAGIDCEFCEYRGMNLNIRQPSNSWSNMSFVFFGIMFLVYAIEDYYDKNKTKINYITKYASFSLIVGISMIFLGLSSFLFHASLIQFASRLDITGVVVSCIIIFSYSILRFASLENFRKTKIFFIKTYRSYIFLIFIFSIMYFIFNFRGREVSLILIIGTVVLNIIIQIKYLPNINFKYFIAAMITIIISIILWLLDKFLICVPESILQLHAAWHILTSLTVYLMYIFFRSETLTK